MSKKRAIRRLLCGILTLCLLLTGLVPASAEFASMGLMLTFKDVPESAWYRDAVYACVEKGYFAGTKPGYFSPSMEMTRGMVVTVLWRMDGAPMGDPAAPFRDVKPEDYFAQAVAWAYAKGVAAGTSAKKFSPNAAVTREQIALMLRQFAAASDKNLDYEDDSLESFPDSGSVSDYAVTAMQWAISRFLLRGRERKGLSWLKPEERLSRAEAAQMLWRFDDCVLNDNPAEPIVPEPAGEPSDSVNLWIDGQLLEEAPIWEDEVYLRGEDLAALTGGRALFTENIRLDLRGHTLFLSQRDRRALVDGAAEKLPARCRYYEGAWYVPAELLTKNLEAHRLDDPEYGQRFYTLTPRNTEIPAGKRVVILRYHCVSDDVWGQEGLFMSPTRLEEQIAAMKEMGCTFLTFEDLDRVDQYELPVLLTFDDGYRDNYTELFPILERQNVKATIFMITKYVGSSRSLTADQLRELSESGLVSIQSHTHTHTDMTAKTAEELREDYGTSQLTIARITRRIPFVMSYPRGLCSELAESVAAEYFEFAVLANTSPWYTGTDPYAASRFGMPRAITDEQWMAYFEDP